MGRVTDTQQNHQILDFALRVGEMLLSNGAGVADVTATIGSICRHLGLRQVSVDATFITLNVTHQERAEEPQLALTRHVTQREIDHDDLTRVDHLVRALLRDKLSLDEARSELARIQSTGHNYPRWSISVAWGFTGAGLGVLLGGDWLVAVLAFFASAGIEIIQRRMARLRLPFFYQQVTGGLFATLFAVAAAALHAPTDPSLIVSACIITLLAGLGFIGAIQDALSGFYITANARILEVFIATAGIVVGVSGGLSVGRMVGVSIHLEPGAAGWTQIPIMAVGGAISAAAFAYSVFAPPRALLPIGVVSLGAALIYLVMTGNDIERTWATTVAAIYIGLVSYTVAGWFKIPPLVVVVSTIVPLLPGLAIYRALSLMSDGDSSGVLWFVTAAGVALALAAGVIFGEYVAQPLQRESRRLEVRLAGPRLVGPLRIRHVRRGKRGGTTDGSGT